MNPNVTVIPAKERVNGTGQEKQTKRRVAAYARVSTDTEEQASSYAFQVQYYQQSIQSNTEWEFVEVYTDEGVTGTNTKHREGFQRMIADCEAGKIDLILTKSVSRFARNTVDSLTHIRRLRELGIEVFFEKENIATLDAKGELLLTIMASLAQEESRSISENITWAKRKRLAEGIMPLNPSKFLGYEHDAEGNIVINEEEAKTVRLIYSLYIEGYNYTQIGEELQRRGIKTITGNTDWHPSTIRYVLINEKYKGDALLQKCFVVDHLSHRQIKNRGQIPQYYVKDNHPPIIPPETFDMVQEMFHWRANLGTRYSSKTPYSLKLVCNRCGAWYTTNIWSPDKPYRKVVYVCSEKYRREHKCESPILQIRDIQNAFLSALNQLIQKSNFQTRLRTVREKIADTKELEEEIDKEKEQLPSEEPSPRLLELQTELQTRKNMTHRLALFSKTIKESKEPITHFDEILWRSLTEKMVVHSKVDIKIIWKDGSKMACYPFQLH